jgi:hydrogenase maturation protease
MAKKLLVVGVGNTIMGDDGTGVCALRELQSKGLPDGVDVIEAGTALLDALPSLKPYSWMLILDAIESTSDQVVTIHDPLSTSLPAQILSLHDVGIREALTITLLEQGFLPEVTVMGIRPERTAFVDELSENVAARLPALVEAASNEISRRVSQECPASVLN